jgi:gamma-glutamyl hydrolase
VAIAEAIVRPWFLTQFHPEKSIYEWRIDEPINHSPSTVQAMQYFADFFVAESRQNNNSFASKSLEQSSLIYNFSPVFTASVLPDFQQTYYFYDQ